MGSVLLRLATALACVLFIFSTMAVTSSMAQDPTDRHCPVENEIDVSELCASFNHSPPKPTVEDTISLDASSSFDPTSSIGIRGYKWSLADRGGPDDPLNGKTGVTTSVSFDTPGVYPVRLRIANSRISQIYKKNITVINTPPSISLHRSPEEPSLGESIVLDASDSYDTEYGIKSYEWDLGDGTRKSGSKIEHRYDKVGDYDVSLSVSDGKTAAIETYTVTVESNPPKPELEVESLPDRLTVNDTIVLNASKSYDIDRRSMQDPDLHNIEGVGIKEYVWQLGDGTTMSGEVVNYSYKKPGEYEVTLEVNDGVDTSTKKTDLDVINRPPEPRFEYSPSSEPRVGQSIAFDASDSDDPDGDIEKYTWEFGDGDTAEGESVDHSYDEIGVYEVELTVNDTTETVVKQKQITVEPGEQSMDGFDLFSALMSGSFIIITSVLARIFNINSESD